MINQSKESERNKESGLVEAGEIEIDGVLYKLFLLPIPQDTVDEMIKNGESSEEVFDSCLERIIKKIVRSFQKFNKKKE